MPELLKKVTRSILKYEPFFRKKVPLLNLIFSTLKLSKLLTLNPLPCTLLRFWCGPTPVRLATFVTSITVLRVKEVENGVAGEVGVVGIIL